MRRRWTPARADRGVSGEGILLTLAYDGRPFSGWALQPGARTVAGEVLGAVQAVDPAVSALRGASRTDAGVHARSQLAAFDPLVSIPPRGWALALAAHLPDEISVRRAARVEAGTDPRGAAEKKRYRYTILLDPVRDPFWQGRALRWAGDLDLSAAGAEASTLVGTHDFAAFRSSSDGRTNTVRTIHEATVVVDGADPRLVFIDVVGSGFLHNMVRIVVGTLLDVARGRLAVGAVQRGIDTKRRDVLGMTAPAEGLCLEHIAHAIPVQEAWPEPRAISPHPCRPLGG
jgi:tRNA pseudouridine38-40 synthase